MREVSSGSIRGGAGARTRIPVAILAVLFLISGFLVLVPDDARACSCVAPGSSSGQGEIAREALEDSGAVFAGEAVEIEDPPLRSVTGSGDPMPVSFRVFEVWKGPERRSLEITTAVSEASCGYTFQEGREYLVYASNEMDVQLCGQTKLLEDADADLRALGAGDAPMESLLPETSGGMPGLFYPLWIAATGSLLIAAAFLLGRDFRRKS